MHTFRSHIQWTNIGEILEGQIMGPLSDILNMPQIVKTNYGTN